MAINHFSKNIILLFLLLEIIVSCSKNVEAIDLDNHISVSSNEDVIKCVIHNVSMELKTIPIRYVGFPSTIYSDRYPGEGLKGLLFRNCDDSTRILSCIPDGQIEERYICEECNKERDKYKLLYEKTQIGICVVHNLPMRNVHTGILYTNIDSNTNSDTIIQWDGKGPNPEGPLSGTLIYLNPPDINNKEYTGTKYLRLEQEYFPNSNNNLDNKEYICDKCNEERDKYKNKI